MWEATDEQTVRLNPAAFPELPRKLVAALQRRGCTVPQVPMIDGRQNVIKGEFAMAGEIDWAVLCSVRRVSSILIFWAGSEVNFAEIEKRKDLDGLQGWGGTKIVYSRKIALADKIFIRDHATILGAVKPPPIDHQGIDDEFVGKGSEVLYLYRGKWLHLTGAD